MTERSPLRRFTDFLGITRSGTPLLPWWVLVGSALALGVLAVLGLFLAESRRDTVICGVLLVAACLAVLLGNTLRRRSPDT